MKTARKKKGKRLARNPSGKKWTAHRKAGGNINTWRVSQVTGVPLTDLATLDRVFDEAWNATAGRLSGMTSAEVDQAYRRAAATLRIALPEPKRRVGESWAAFAERSRQEGRAAASAERYIVEAPHDSVMVTGREEADREFHRFIRAGNIPVRIRNSGHPARFLYGEWEVGDRGEHLTSHQHAEIMAATREYRFLSRFDSPPFSAGTFARARTPLRTPATTERARAIAAREALAREFAAKEAKPAGAAKASAREATRLSPEDLLEGKTDPKADRARREEQLADIAKRFKTLELNPLKVRKSSGDREPTLPYLVIESTHDGAATVASATTSKEAVDFAKEHVADYTRRGLGPVNVVVLGHNRCYYEGHVPRPARAEKNPPPFRYPMVPPGASPLHSNPSDPFGVPQGAHLVPVRGTKTPKPGRQLSTPAAVHKYMEDAYSSPMERFYALLLDRQHRVLGVVIVSQGSVGETSVHPREALAPAIEARASSVVFVHNHPSGGSHPSDADIEVTKRLVAAGRLVGIEVEDHIVVGDRSFTSIRQTEPGLWS